MYEEGGYPLALVPYRGGPNGNGHGSYDMQTALDKKQAEINRGKAKKDSKDEWAKQQEGRAIREAQNAKDIRQRIQMATRRAEESRHQRWEAGRRQMAQKQLKSAMAEEEEQQQQKEARRQQVITSMRDRLRRARAHDLAMAKRDEHEKHKTRRFQEDKEKRKDAMKKVEAEVERQQVEKLHQDEEKERAAFNDAFISNLRDLQKTTGSRGSVRDALKGELQKNEDEKEKERAEKQQKETEEKEKRELCAMIKKFTMQETPPLTKMTACEKMKLFEEFVRENALKLDLKLGNDFGKFLQYNNLADN
tara:strand:+ start:229 stop:1146 length:918 start_codon:yes stop_codon:yes gene_type:complete